MSTTPDGAPATAPSALAPLARWALGLALVAVAAIALLLATTPDAVEGDPTVDVAARLCLVLAVVAGAFVLVAPLSAKTKGWVVAGLVGIYLFAAAALVLSGSPFPPIGIALDQGFRTASITKYSHSIAFVDFAYKGLPPYYPPLFFWVLGRLARWTDTSAYEALKIGALVTALVVPLIAVRFWAAITRDWAIAVAVAVIGLAFTDWYEPYGWLAVIVFVPWFLLFVLQVGRRHDLSPGMTVAGMVIGAALVMTYYYPFFIGALALAGLLAARRVAAAHGIALGPKFPRRTVIVLVGTAAISAVYWLPLLVSVATTSGAKGYQNRYLDPATVDVPLPFLTFDLVGFVLLFGLGYLVLSARHSPASRGLLALLGGAYAWIAFGYVGILVDVPLLTAKTVPVIEYTLVVGAAAGAVMIGRQIAANATVRRRVGTAGLVLALGGGAVVVALALGQEAITAIPYVKEQREAVRPTKLLIQFAARPTAATTTPSCSPMSSSSPSCSRCSCSTCGTRDYANPASQFDERARFLQRLSNEDDPTVFAAALPRNRFDTVASIAFRTTDGDTFTYAFLDDAFPRWCGTTRVPFLVRPVRRHVLRRVTAPARRVHSRAGDPTHDLDHAQRRELHAHFAGDLDTP